MEKENYIIQLEKFGKRVRQLRNNQKLTLLEMEVRTNINNGDLSRIENGKTNIEFFTIAKIAEALNVPLLELFSFTQEPTEIKKKSTTSAKIPKNKKNAKSKLPR
ncbi:MAG: helix-turn-helix transcriptional regulator [Bacteroidetes bacterium]|nr:helix-turn-helix transcriptional regulator [Bacteroidota bacterium]